MDHRAALERKFVLRSLLGEGATSAVWLAEPRGGGRPLVVKAFVRTLGEGTEEARFDREVRALARLKHPAIVGIVDWGHLEGLPFLVMEHRPGRTLESLLKERGHLDWRATARLGAALAEALGHAHEQGILHRDVKPANVLVADDGAPVLIDFGLATSGLGATFRTATGLILGTPAYLAPELARGEAATPASDLYALGSVLFEAVSGRVPFPGDLALTIKARLAGPAPCLRPLAPATSPAFARLVDGLLAPRPERTPEGGAELARRLEACLTEPVPGPAQATVPNVKAAGEARGRVQAGPPPRQGGLRRSAPAAVLGAALVAAAGWWLRPVEAPPSRTVEARPPAAAAEPLELLMTRIEATLAALIAGGQRPDDVRDLFGEVARLRRDLLPHREAFATRVPGTQAALLSFAVLRWATEAPRPARSGALKMFHALVPCARGLELRATDVRPEAMEWLAWLGAEPDAAEAVDALLLRWCDSREGSTQEQEVVAPTCRQMLALRALRGGWLQASEAAQFWREVDRFDVLGAVNPVRGLPLVPAARVAAAEALATRRSPAAFECVAPLLPRAAQWPSCSVSLYRVAREAARLAGRSAPLVAALLEALAAADTADARGLATAALLGALLTDEPSGATASALGARLRADGRLPAGAVPPWLDDASLTCLAELATGLPERLPTADAVSRLAARAAGAGGTDGRWLLAGACRLSAPWNAAGLQAPPGLAAALAPTSGGPEELLVGAALQTALGASGAATPDLSVALGLLEALPRDVPRRRWSATANELLELLPHPSVDPNPSAPLRVLRLCGRPPPGDGEAACLVLRAARAVIDRAKLDLRSADPRPPGLPSSEVCHELLLEATTALGEIDGSVLHGQSAGYVRVQRGWCLDDLRRYEEARVAVLDVAPTAVPRATRWQYHLLLGTALARQRRHAEAEEQIRLAKSCPDARLDVIEGIRLSLPR